MIPFVSKEQIAELDRLMVERFHIPVVMMMELAGYRMAEFIRDNFRSSNDILVCIGKGNNGGDGLSAVRHLLNFGFSPKVFLASDEIGDIPRMHLEIVRALGLPIFDSLEQLRSEIASADVIVDCLIGYNLSGAPRGRFSDIIRLVNSALLDSAVSIIACDIPSGIDADKGITQDIYIKAADILFLSLPKIGCKEIDANLYVADIGVPKKLYPLIDVIFNF